MPQGIKSIKWADGLAYPKMSIPNKKLTIAPDQFVWFAVSEWENGVTAPEKKKNVTWMRENSQRNIMISQMTLPYDNKYGLKIPKKLCGPYAYFIEASISGKPYINDTKGLYVSGYCPARIVSSKWSTASNGDDVRKSVFSYGHIVYLGLETEGLNGSKVIIDIFRKVPGGGGLDDDQLIFTYTDVRVTDGVVDLKIGNTFQWYARMGRPKSLEEFYIKVKDASGKYVSDGKDSVHARFLRIKNEIVSRGVEPSTNLTPTKIGKPDANAIRYEPCKFTSIKISETEIKDGKPNTQTVTIFDNGKKLQGQKNPEEKVYRSIIFNFKEDTLTKESQEDLNNILGFLLEHQYTTIELSGYACVIGSKEFNLSLSKRRADRVKKFLTDGKLDGNRIISTGYGEIQVRNKDKNDFIIATNDDKKGADNIKHKDEESYHLARRADIKFSAFGHDASPVVYETIAPSKGREKTITIEATDFDTSRCFQDKSHKHRKEIRVTSPDGAAKIGAAKLGLPIHSTLSSINPEPLQYIWPKFNLIEGIEGNGIDSAAVYSGDIHSCRYFSINNHPTFLIKVYPDIKWELAFELKIDIEHYSHTNMPAGPIFEKHQKKAREAGYARWLMNKQGKVPIEMGLGLKASWDEGTKKADLVEKFKTKIETTAQTLAKSVEVIQSAINLCKGVAETTSIPISFGVQYPKIEAVASWYLKKEPTYLQVAVLGEVSFGAKPLIGANATIDLIAAAVTVASYATTGSPAIAKIVQKVRDAGKIIGAEITAEAKFYGELEVTLSDLGINSLTGIKGGKVIIGGKMGVTITIEGKAGDVKVENKVLSKIIPKISALAKADAAFGGDLTIDSDKKGIYVEPTVKFSGVKVVLDIKTEVGWLSRSYHVEDVVIKEKIKPLGKKYITD